MFSFSSLFVIYLLFMPPFILNFPYFGSPNNIGKPKVGRYDKDTNEILTISSKKNASEKNSVKENYILKTKSLRFKRDLSAEDEEKIYEKIRKISPIKIKLAFMSSVSRVQPQDLKNDCCYNNGICHKKGKDYFCTCPPQFTGRFCFEDINECEKGTAKCPSDMYCFNTYGSYNCSCPPGFIRNEMRCERQVTCKEEPCQNGAICIDGFNDESISCICQIGFVGKRCQFMLPECDDFSCADNEFCISTDKGFRCIPLKFISKNVI
ncbi:fibropellin-1-like [Centruroides sculpturatus]|uniref:fibropellin-1-like n=1 Tax=Centruroides sculpturatus TaxID=218467 RepID=UPI000C6E8988|nr:fibropellin-1-like [Centruroides sculpturatus]